MRIQTIRGLVLREKTKLPLDMLSLRRWWEIIDLQRVDSLAEARTRLLRVMWDAYFQLGSWKGHRAWKQSARRYQATRAGREQSFKSQKGNDKHVISSQ